MTAKTFNGIAVPEGEVVTRKDGKVVVPARPIIPFIEGDGIGPEITAATQRILEAAVKAAYGDSRGLVWMEIFAGSKATAKLGNVFPDDTIAAIRHFGIGMKGPLDTPTGGGMRSINVRLRQTFDLYRCVRPVRYFTGVPSPVVHPEKLDIVIFRENTEDVYAGIEFKAESAEARKIIALLAELGVTVRDDTGIGIKIQSRHGAKRLVRAAIEYALENGRKVVTIVHKGNIQKFTEGAFREWGYEVARDEFADKTITEADLWAKHNGVLPEGKILVNDRIADAFLHDICIKPEKFSVIATMNLNGDYFSDDSAGMVGGLGIAPGANIGDDCAIFEATHGTAPDIAGQNKANPGSLLLSGAMMLEYLGWTEAAKLVAEAFAKAIDAKTVTGDLARYMEGATALSTSDFADAVIKHLPAPAAKAQEPVKPADTAAPAQA